MTLQETGEESQKPLRAAVDDIDFMQTHCVDNLLAFLQLALGARYKLGLRTCATQATPQTY